MINAIIKNKEKIIRHLLRYNQFIVINMEEKITVNILEGDSVNHSLKKIFQRTEFTSYRQLKKTANDRHER